MRINAPNIVYAALHPLRALRYLRHRDRIAYSQIAPYLPSNPVIVEAGAHDGTNTIEMANFWPKATIHAFEPVPPAADRVTERISRFGSRVQCHPVGLGPKNGEVEMHLSGDGSPGACQSSSMLFPTAAQLREFPGVQFHITQKLPILTLDTWADRQGVSCVDFLWLDMQGYEMQALDGAARVLPGVAAIHMEVSNIRLYQDAPLYTEVKRRMKDLGLVVAAEAIFRIGGNVLFVRPDHRSQ